MIIGTNHLNCLPPRARELHGSLSTPVEINSRLFRAWKGPPILALVIGINKYTSPTLSCLQGAVADADNFEDFLKESLKVPDTNIISLRDEQASRQKILSAFTSLRNIAKYKKDEAAIIIYFAGHGAQTNKTNEWHDWDASNGRVGLICPSDIGRPTIARANGVEYEDVIQGISGRLVSAHLNRISHVKGNNIVSIFHSLKSNLTKLSTPKTLILDCCFSAGINRRSGNITDSFSGKFHSSYVLLAACGRDQKAREHPVTKEGLFTSNLMKVLRANDINTLTYTSLIDRMEMPDLW